MTHINRLLSKAKREGECLVWTAGFFASGYGKFQINRQSCGAHRVSYELQVGPIPEGMSVLHRCDNRACIAPEHLFLGTQRDNMRDMNEKGRHFTKVTPEIVRLIRTSSGVTQADMARHYGMTQGGISDIVTRKTWKHI